MSTVKHALETLLHDIKAHLAVGDTDAVNKLLEAKPVFDALEQAEQLPVDVIPEEAPVLTEETHTEEIPAEQPPVVVEEHSYGN